MSAGTDRLARRLFVEGRVQGVGFRWALTQRARELGLDGWVRNLGDGRVEALASGPADAVDALTAWAHRGPPQARVDRVVWRDEPDDGTAKGFGQRPTL